VLPIIRGPLKYFSTNKIRKRKEKENEGKGKHTSKEVHFLSIRKY